MNAMTKHFGNDLPEIIIVLVVILIFLQDWRAMLVPATTIPVTSTAPKLATNTPCSKANAPSAVSSSSSTSS